MVMIVYISHPYGGLEENKREIEQIILKLVETNPQNTYISPVHTFGFLYDAVPYEEGLEMCLDLLGLCDMAFIFGDYANSTGCKAELSHCEMTGKPYVIMN
jgi:hypothetical protein